MCVYLKLLFLGFTKRLQRVFMRPKKFKRVLTTPFFKSRRFRNVNGLLKNLFFSCLGIKIPRKKIRLLRGVLAKRHKLKKKKKQKVKYGRITQKKKIL